MKSLKFMKLTIKTLLVAALGICAAFGSGVALAAEGAQKTYTVEAGDTLDKVIRKFYPGSPLKIEVLRSMITERNRAAFTKGETKMLMAGATLTLPDQMEIAIAVLLPKGEKTADKGEYKGENGLGTDNANLHRSWVRFP